jgi:hypothetical protein
MICVCFCYIEKKKYHICNVKCNIVRSYLHIAVLLKNAELLQLLAITIHYCEHKLMK